jgi:HAE1 family hydrophobic/amphiphilic exporter-1
VAAKLPRPDGGQVDVRLRLSDAVRHDAHAVAELPITRVGDAMVTLGQVATLVEAQTPAQITRVDRQRLFTVAASPNGVPLGSATEAARAALAPPGLPPGVRWELAGGSRSQAEAFTQLGLAIGAGALLSYAVLAVLFGSFVQPFVVLLCLPFALIGALLGLLFFGYTLNLLSLIGLVALFGLVGKNSILLVDAANQFRARGLSSGDALRAAGPIRLRPILMTSLTLMLGLAPIALGLGEGGAIRAPLTAVIVGGMTTSTALTLVFVPAIYVLLERLTETAGSLPRRLTRRPVPTSPAAPGPAGAFGA